ncbi:MAG: hypothetical protein JOZ02_13700 [Acidobacteria bacterium]|nr:hypothetical protein [Acidobacteriota bacterium]
MSTVFQCPGCKEFISRDATSCRFCNRPIDPQTRQAAAAAAEVENREYRKKQSLRTMLIGLAMAAVGIVITVGTYAWAASSPRGGGYVVTWGLIVFGGLRVVQGFIGWASGK